MIEDLWYKNSVIYSLDIDTFVDGNGDGVGDITGVIRRLDYLQTLGIDVIWIAPLHPSPGRDNGYDVSDYYGVDPRHGSAGDFVELVHQAKKRGLKVIMDLVVNHTSDQHPWFQEARKGRDNPYHDWYVWSKKRPADWNEGMVFPGVQRSTWTLDKKAGEYYFHRFYEFQPDLNIDNPAVRTEIRRIMGFWLQIGVDGFRVDAVPFIIEHPDLAKPDRKPEMKFEYIEEMRQFLQWRAGDSVLLGEANVKPDENRKYFREGRGIHMMFNFWVNQRAFYALASSDTRPLRKALEETRELPHYAQWAQFLRNHDELDLGRLTEKQRQLVFERFGPEKRMQIYDRGIRRRLAPMLGNRACSELAYSLCFSLPGTPVIRYGDEIGMGDNLALEQREAVRTPMQWSSHRNGGFSTAGKLVVPMMDEGVYDCRHVNVEDQRRDSGSMLRWMMRLIRVRKECPEIGWGTWELLDPGDDSILCMRYDWRGNSIVTIHNFAEEPREAIIDLGTGENERLNNLFEAEELSSEDATFAIVIPAWGYRWYRVGDMNYALQREAEDPALDGAHHVPHTGRKRTKSRGSNGPGRRAPRKTK